MFGSFDRPVRCKDGHLFTTIWVPIGSLKAIRWFNQRYQYCPAGHHWTWVTPINVATASEVELAQAAAVHDIPIP